MPSRTVQEIKETGAAWVAESELGYLCDSFLEFEAEVERLRAALEGCDEQRALNDRLKDRIEKQREATYRDSVELGNLLEENERLRAALWRMVEEFKREWGHDLERTEECCSTCDAVHEAVRVWERGRR